MMLTVTGEDGLEELTVQFARAAGLIKPALDASLTKEAVVVKAAMRAGASGHRNLARLPFSINYEKVGPGMVEVSADDTNQGMLAHIAAFGGRHKGPVWDAFAPAGPAEIRLAEWSAKIGATLIEGGTP